MQFLKPNISHIDEAFKINETEENHLFISVSLNNFSYSLWNKNSNKYIVLESYVFQKQETLFQLCENISTIAKENPILKSGFKNITVFVQNNKSTLIPKSLFDETNKEEYFKFNHLIESNEVIVYEKLPSMNAINLYTINELLIENIQTNFPNAKIIHASTPIIENLSKINKNKAQNIDEVYLNIQSSYFEILYFKNNTLQLYNIFNYKTAEDFAYYLLFTFEQIQINPTTICLKLLGEIEKESAIFEYLFKYVMNIEFITRNENMKYSEKISNLPSHYYYLLLNSNA
jgi:hypothetical protein